MEKKIFPGLVNLIIFISLCISTIFPLNTYPAPITGCIESESYPIKVCYEEEADISLAQETLSSIERVWPIVIDQLGFSQPWRLDSNSNPERGIEAILTDLGPDIAGYAQPVADIPETPISDCAARLNINKTMPYYYLRMVVSHEFGHMVQMADDCTESISEALPSYISILIVKFSNGIPIDRYLEWMAEMFFESFQTHPFKALDYENYTDEDLMYYAYGHSLFDMYLDEKWGEGTGEIIAEISSATSQNGTVVISNGVATLQSGENEPDLYDAIDIVLQPKGGSFWDAVKEFSIWRLFTGDRADNNHFRYAGLIPPVSIEARFQMAELPLTGLNPTSPPAETGTVYMEVEVDSETINNNEDMIVFDITSSESPNWFITAASFKNDNNSSVTTTVVQNGEGYISVSNLREIKSIVFGVTNMGDLVHDPDDREFDDNNFTYSIHFYRKPIIYEINPGQVFQGETSIPISITGEGFKDGISIDFGEGLTMKDINISLSGDKIDGTMDVSNDAKTGWHPLRIYYKNGPETTVENAIEVLSSAGPVLKALNPDHAPQGKRLNIEISGENFRNGLQVSFEGEGISVLRVDFVDQQTAIAEIDINPSATPGTRNVTVTNPDSKSSVLESGFTVEEIQNQQEEKIVDRGCGCTIIRSSQESDTFKFPFLLVTFSLLLFTRNRIRKAKSSGKNSRLLLIATAFVFLYVKSASSSDEKPNQSDVESRVQKIYDLLSPSYSINKNQKLNEALNYNKCYTGKRIEAFRIYNSLPEQRKKELKPLFAPPVPLGCIESQIYPIKSCYNTESEIPKAEAILRYAQESWRILIDETGFWTPKKGSFLAPETGVDFYLGDTYSYGAEAYTSPEGYDETSAHTSCLTYIVINERMEPMDYYVTVVGHELCHACQLSMDCTETFNSMEATSTWTEPVLYPGAYYTFLYLLPEFQKHPERSVGYWEYNDAYMYGAALFIFYVQEFLGGNEPSSIARIWEGTVQSGMNNEPDLLDAIIFLAQEKSISFNEVFSEFGEWRYFIGALDDGKHFQNGAMWRGGEVAENSPITISSPDRLPVSTGKDLQPLGYLFQPLNIDITAFPKGRLLVSGQGLSSSDWNMEVWFIKNNMVERSESIISDENGRLRLLIESDDLIEINRMMLMVLNLGKNVDWDQNWREEHFSTVIDYLYYPVVTSIEPDKIYVGRNNDIKIVGDHFSSEPKVLISGEGVEIKNTTVENTRQLLCRVAVSEDAPLGKRDLIVANYATPEDMNATVRDAIEIVYPPVAILTGLDPEHGMPGENLIVRADGSNFSSDLKGEFDCQEIEITQVRFVNEKTIYLYITIASDSPYKTCQLSFTDKYARKTSMRNAFTITGNQSDEKQERAGELQVYGGSCGCRIVY